VALPSLTPTAKQTTAVMEPLVVFVFAGETPTAETALFGGVSPANTPEKKTKILQTLTSNNFLDF
jgi:hypothetical protein